MRALVLLLLVAGCDVGNGTGSVSGAVFIAQCTQTTSYNNNAFDLPARFFTAEPVEDLMHLEQKNRVNMRIQSTGNLIEEADAVFINISDVQAIAAMNGQPIEVGPNTITRASLGLNETCPQIDVQAELDGTITFSSFGQPASDGGVIRRIAPGTRINATFSFTIVDRRAATLAGVGNVTSAPDVAGNLVGYFDFIVEEGRAAQLFP